MKEHTSKWYLFFSISLDKILFFTLLLGLLVRFEIILLFFCFFSWQVPNHSILFIWRQGSGHSLLPISAGGAPQRHQLQHIPVQTQTLQVTTVQRVVQVSCSFKYNLVKMACLIRDVKVEAMVVSERLFVVFFRQTLPTLSAVNYNVYFLCQKS